jgi:hypothetical protein
MKFYHDDILFGGFDELNLMSWIFTTHREDQLSFWMDYSKK